MLLPIHIVAGGLAIILGAVALSVTKGGTIHRRSGVLFVYAMLIMALTASILSLLNGRADGNLLVGVFSAAMPVLHMKGLRYSEIAASPGGFFFVWTLWALGGLGGLTFILSARGLWSLRAGQPR